MADLTQQDKLNLAVLHLQQAVKLLQALGTIEGKSRPEIETGNTLGIHVKDTVKGIEKLKGG